MPTSFGEQFLLIPLIHADPFLLLSAFFTDEKKINPVLVGQPIYLKPAQSRRNDDPAYDRQRHVMDYDEETLVSELPFYAEYVYDKRGNKFPLAGSRADDQEEECSVFTDLRGQTTLVPPTIPPDPYESDDDYDDDYEPTGMYSAPSDPPIYNVYYQAFSPHYGNIQTNNSFFHFFQDFPGSVQKLVENLSRMSVAEAIILVGGHQLYQEFCHKLRGQFGHMDVQQAGIAALFAGENFTNTKKFDSLSRRLGIGLPHETLKATIAGTPCHFGLRNEAYCTIQVEHLPEMLRGGQ